MEKKESTDIALSVRSVSNNQLSITDLASKEERNILWLFEQN